MDNVALTINSPTLAAGTAQIVVDVSGGSHFNNIVCPTRDNNLYWIVVFDRTTLKVVANFTFSDNSTVPAQLNPYLNKSEYIYVLTTQRLGSNNLPTGAFYKWLKGEGAGIGLASLEQIYGALNCGYYGWFSYTMIDIFGNDGSGNTLDFYNVQDNNLLNPVQLQPIEVNGTVFYTPITLT